MNVYKYARADCQIYVSRACDGAIAAMLGTGKIDVGQCGADGLAEINCSSSLLSVAPNGLDDATARPLLELHIFWRCFVPSDDG